MQKLKSEEKYCLDDYWYITPTVSESEIKITIEKEGSVYTSVIITDPTYLDEQMD